MTQNCGFAGQRGAVIILFFLALFITGATVVLSALNNRSTNVARGVETQVAMETAKEALLTYALMYSTEYAGSGPGRLPCVDTDNDGLADCAGAQLGRLPREVILPSGATYPLTDSGAGIDQQLWYAVSPSFRSTAAVVNSNTSGSMILDGDSGIVAVLLAPGPALVGQTRPGVNANSYLEDSNISSPDFVSNSALASFNDRVLSIRRVDLLTFVTPRVAQEIKRMLDIYHTANGNSYPLPASFLTAMTAGWLVNNNWHTSVEQYQLSSPPNIATIKFLNCDIVFTLTFGSAAIARSQASC